MREDEGEGGEVAGRRRGGKVAGRMKGIIECKMLVKTEGEDEEEDESGRVHTSQGMRERREGG